MELVHTASLPGLWERTIALGSAGKAFNTTGWKLGARRDGAVLAARPSVSRTDAAPRLSFRRLGAGPGAAD